MCIRDREVARDVIRRESHSGIRTSARIGRGPAVAGDADGSGGVEMVIVELSVPLRLWDWQTPVRGSVSALVPVEPR